MSTLDIIFEDQHLLALNKPAGLNSVIQENGGESLAEMLIEKDPGFSSVALKKEDAGLLQRLDRETSGVILAAKNRELWLKCRKLEIKKTYLALVEGESSSSFEVQCYLGSPHRGSKKVKVYTSKPAKKARALRSHSTFNRLNFSEKLNSSLVRVTLYQGRRHQVRAHAAWAGHPLCGDALYGSALDLKKLLDAHAPKFFLHAESVEFKHPITDKLMFIEAPQPDYSLKL